MSESEELAIFVNDYTRDYIVRELNGGVEIEGDPDDGLVYIVRKDEPNELVTLEEFNERDDFTWLFTRISTYLKWVEKLWGYTPSRRLGDVK